MAETHFEPYIHLVEVTDQAALIAWGGFFFQVKSRDDWYLIDDSDLKRLPIARRNSIGEQSQPYAKEGVRLEIYEAQTNKLVLTQPTNRVNHCWVSGLQPHTEYRYKIFVDNQEWAAGERYDWVNSASGGMLKPSGRQYDNRFRTRPAPQDKVDFNFLILGDYGHGIHKPATTEHCQQAIADTLAWAVDHYDIRLMLTTGDNIYNHSTNHHAGGSGNEDDDWFYTFYQPYRYIINRIPIYPSCGNHDTGEMEASDDRDQLYDNFYIRNRFAFTPSLASLDPGLFYRFAYGAQAEFIALDTSTEKSVARLIAVGKRQFEKSEHQPFLETTFAASVEAPKIWRIPFAHHPPYCAGPRHHNFNEGISFANKYLKRAQIRVFFCGHEHNFQHSQDGNLDFFITGGGGEIRTGRPDKFPEAKTQEWASGGHFLVVKVRSSELEILPITTDRQLLALKKPDGKDAEKNSYLLKL
jgi:tartrate-resistant acid phosphatase type 5